jgi:hypothetical protein
MKAMDDRLFFPAIEWRAYPHSRFRETQKACSGMRGGERDAPPALASASFLNRNSFRRSMTALFLESKNQRAFLLSFGAPGRRLVPGLESGEKFFAYFS